MTHIWWNNSIHTTHCALQHDRTTLSTIVNGKGKVVHVLN